MSDETTTQSSGAVSSVSTDDTSAPTHPHLSTNPVGQLQLSPPAVSQPPLRVEYLIFQLGLWRKWGKYIKLMWGLPFPESGGGGEVWAGIWLFLVQIQLGPFNGLWTMLHSPPLAFGPYQPSPGCSTGEDQPADGDISSFLHLLLLRSIHGGSDNDHMHPQRSCTLIATG